jgi:hypothetical protein
VAERLLISGPEGVMKNLCSLIVISPESPEIWRIHVSKKAVVILAIAFVLSFVVSVTLTQGLQQPTLNEADYTQLQAENRDMEIVNRNAELRTRKVDMALSNIEAQTKRITSLMEN